MTEDISGQAVRKGSASLRAFMGRAHSAQLAWTIVSASWNAAGAYLIANGQPALGPAASVPAALILIAIGAGFVVSVARWPVVYLVLSILTSLLGLYAVVNAFTADPALWPSEFWRLSGVAINVVAVVCGVIAVGAFARWRRAAVSVNPTAAS